MTKKSKELDVAHNTEQGLEQVGKNQLELDLAMQTQTEPSQTEQSERGQTSDSHELASSRSVSADSPAQVGTEIATEQESIDPFQKLDQLEQLAPKLEQHHVSLSLQVDALDTAQSDVDNSEKTGFAPDIAYSQSRGDLTFNMNDPLTLAALLPNTKTVSLSKLIKNFAYHAGKLLVPDPALEASDSLEQEEYRFRQNIKYTYFVDQGLTLEYLFPNSYPEQSLDQLSERYLSNREVDINGLYLTRLRDKVAARLDERIYSILHPCQKLHLQPGEDLNPLVEPSLEYLPENYILIKQACKRLKAQYPQLSDDELKQKVRERQQSLLIYKHYDYTPFQPCPPDDEASETSQAGANAVAAAEAQVNHGAPSAHGVQMYQRQLLKQDGFYAGNMGQGMPPQVSSAQGNSAYGSPAYGSPHQPAQGGAQVGAQGIHGNAPWQPSPVGQPFANHQPNLVGPYGEGNFAPQRQNFQGQDQGQPQLQQYQSQFQGASFSQPQPKQVVQNPQLQQPHAYQPLPQGGAASVPAHAQFSQNSPALPSKFQGNMPQGNGNNFAQNQGNCNGLGYNQGQRPPFAQQQLQPQPQVLQQSHNLSQDRGQMQFAPQLPSAGGAAHQGQPWPSQQQGQQGQQGQPRFVAAQPQPPFGSNFGQNQGQNQGQNFRGQTFAPQTGHAPAPFNPQFAQNMSQVGPRQGSPLQSRPGSQQGLPQGGQSPQYMHNGAGAFSPFNQNRQGPTQFSQGTNQGSQESQRQLGPQSNRDRGFNSQQPSQGRNLSAPNPQGQWGRPAAAQNAPFANPQGQPNYGAPAGNMGSSGQNMQSQGGFNGSPHGFNPSNPQFHGSSGRSNAMPPNYGAPLQMGRQVGGQPSLQGGNQGQIQGRGQPPQPEPQGDLFAGFTNPPQTLKAPPASEHVRGFGPFVAAQGTNSQHNSPYKEPQQYGAAGSNGVAARAGEYRGTGGSGGTRGSRDTGGAGKS